MKPDTYGGGDTIELAHSGSNAIVRLAEYAIVDHLYDFQSAESDVRDGSGPTV
jgi:hypothetical protein